MKILIGNDFNLYDLNKVRKCKLFLFDKIYKEI